MKNIFRSYYFKHNTSISITLLFLGCLLFSSSLQAMNVDSLKAIVNSSQPDTTRIKVARILSKHYSNSNIDSTIIFAKQMLQLSRKNGLKKQEVLALNRLGGAYEKYSGVEPDSIIAIFQEALAIAEEIDYVELKTHLLNNIGVINLNKGEHDKTIEYCLKALELAKEIELDVSILQSLNLISAVFYYQKEYQKSLTYAKQGLTHARKVDHPQYIANFIHNIGSYYEEIGEVDSTLIYYEQSLEVTRANNMDVFTSMTLVNMGIIHRKKGHLEIAEKYALEAYAIAQKSNYTHGLSEALVSLAEISYHKKRYNDAIEYINQSFEFTKTEKSKLENYAFLKKYHTKLGNYKAALEAMENYSIIQDSIFSLESKQQIEELTTKYEVTQKENENKYLKEKSKSDDKIIKNQTIAAIGLILALLLAIGWGIFTYHTNQKEKQSKAQIEELLNTVKVKNQELERSNTDLESFASVASHDMQEPLRTIGSFVELLKEENEGQFNEDSHLYMTHITEGVSRMNALIQALLTYAKVGKAKMKMQPVSPQQIIDAKLMDLSVKIKERNAQILVDNKALPTTITVEPTQMGIVFYNLINNGIKFNTSSNPTVHIDCVTRENDYLFSVKDNGIGIDSKNHGKIFEIFKRLHRKEEYKGTGIGLASVRRIVGKHGGEIWLESELGEGTTFFFTLPK